MESVPYGETMQEYIFNFLYSIGLSPKMTVLLLSIFPVTELRASIPIGILLLKQDILSVFIFSVIGNVLPIAPIYFLLDPISRKLSQAKYMQKFFEWLFKRAKKHSGIIERYEALGLMIFVGIPLPGTGAWTGCVIASLLRMRFIPTFLAVSLGVVISAVIVTALTLLGKAVL